MHFSLIATVWYQGAAPKPTELKALRGLCGIRNIEVNFVGGKF